MLQELSDLCKAHAFHGGSYSLTLIFIAVVSVIKIHFLYILKDFCDGNIASECISNFCVFFPEKAVHTYSICFPQERWILKIN